MWWGHRILRGIVKIVVLLLFQRKMLFIVPIVNQKNIEQDVDVLDTWFSSALWPFPPWVGRRRLLNLKNTTQHLYLSLVLILYFSGLHE